MQKSFNQSGFSAIELILGAVLVSLIAGASWVAYQHHNNPAPADVVLTPTPTSAQPSPTGAYSGWKTATLKYEKITYQYPANWTVSDESTDAPKGKGGCTYPGHDLITLRSPTGTQVAFNAGQDCFGDANSTAFGSVPITALGQKLYLVFEGGAPPAPPATGPSTACLAPTTNPDTSFSFTSRNIFADGGGAAPENSFCYTAYDPNKVATAPNLTVGQIQNSADFGSAKLIFESMHY